MYLIPNGPIKESFNFLGPLRLLKFKVDISTLSLELLGAVWVHWAVSGTLLPHFFFYGTNTTRGLPAQQYMLHVCTPPLRVQYFNSCTALTLVPASDGVGTSIPLTMT